MKWTTQTFLAICVALPIAAMLVATPTTGCKGESTGPELYVSACARCHGDGLKGGIATGTATSRDLTDGTWQAGVTDAELRQLIRNGKGEMPGFGSVLSLDRIDQIVKFIRSKKAN